MYHTLYPLETSEDRHSNLFGYSTTVYKAIRSLDGKPYALRRIENYLLGNESSIACIEAWGRIKHASVVSVCEGFTTKDFGDTCKKSSQNSINIGLRLSSVVANIGFKIFCLEWIRVIRSKWADVMELYMSINVCHKSYSFFEFSSQSHWTFQNITHIKQSVFK